MKLNELIRKIAETKEVDNTALLYYAREYQLDFQRELHKALRQPEDHDPIPPHRRVRPGISGDELSDFTLFCGQLRDEASRSFPRPAKRIKQLLPDEVWQIVESAAVPEWEKKLERAREITEDNPQLRGIWVILNNPDLAELTQADQISDNVWEAIESLDEDPGIRSFVGDTWPEIREKIRTEHTLNTWRNRVAEAFSRLLKCPDLYEEESFRSVPKSDEVKELLAIDVQVRQPSEIVHLNRLLLEAVFPRFLAQSPGRQPRYWQVADEVFFTLIEDDAYWLSDPVILCQIENWQILAKSGDQDLRAIFNAKFKRIGDALSPLKGAGNWGNHEAVYKHYEEYRRLSDELGKKYKALSGKERNRAIRLGRLLDQLIEEAPYRYLYAFTVDNRVEGDLTTAEREQAIEHLKRWVPYNRTTSKKIARTIIAHESGLSEQTIKNIIKEHNKKVE